MVTKEDFYFFVDYYMVLVAFLFVSAVVLLSIFNINKELYRFFILNQALIETFYCLFRIYYRWFDGDITGIDIFNFFDLFVYATCAALFILTFSRFYCMFFSKSYDKIVTKKTVVPLILFFDMLFFGIYIGLTYLEYIMIAQEYDHWPKGICQNIDNYFYYSDYYDGNNGVYLDDIEYYNRKKMIKKDYDYSECLAEMNKRKLIGNIGSELLYIVNVFLILSSVLFSLSIFWLVRKSLKFQSNSGNIEALKNSYKISLILLLQSFEMMLIGISYLLFILFNINDGLKDAPDFVTFFTTNDESFLKLKILIDSVILIFFMSAYRTSLFCFVKIGRAHV